MYRATPVSLIIDDAVYISYVQVKRARSQSKSPPQLGDGQRVGLSIVSGMEEGRQRESEKKRNSKDVHVWFVTKLLVRKKYSISLLPFIRHTSEPWIVPIANF